MSVDPKSYELAEAYLGDYEGVTPALTMAMAEDIQLAIEDFFLIHPELKEKAKPVSESDL
jgi:hypothetical protein